MPPFPIPVEISITNRWEFGTEEEGMENVDMESGFGVGRDGGKERLQYFSNSAEIPPILPEGTGKRRKEITMRCSPNTLIAPRQALWVNCLP